MNYYEYDSEVKPPFTMGQMQEISQDDELWLKYLEQVERYRNKFFLYGLVCGTLLVGLIQVAWLMFTT